MANLSQIEHGTSQVHIGSLPSNSNEQVIAQALSTFALQVPNTVQSSLRSSSVTIIFLMVMSVLINVCVCLYFNYTSKKDFEACISMFNKIDERHKRMTQYAKEHDYRILTKEEKQKSLD